MGRLAGTSKASVEIREIIMKTAGRLIIGALSVVMALAACQAPPPKPMATVEDTVEVSATVEKVDVLNRMLSLKTESGEVVTVEVDPAVQNLVQVNPGDRVVARYRQAIGATISKEAAGQPVTVDVEADRAKLGQKPSARASQTTNVPVTITAVDTKTNQVTFHGADGLVRVFTVQTPQAKEFIKQLKPGDTVVVTFTEALALSVEPAK
jgi:translation initiation factor IF-1